MKYAGNITSSSQAALRDLPLSSATIGQAVKASKQTVSQWRTGRTSPDDANRRVLAAKYGISAAGWDLPPPEPSEPAPPRGRPRSAPLDDPDPLDDGAELVGDLDDTDALRELVRQLREKRRGKGVVPSVLAKLAACEIAARREIERRRTDHERLFKSADYLEAERTLLDALRPHPLALVAAGVALAQLSGDDAGVAKGEAAAALLRVQYPALVAALESAARALVEAAERHRPGAASSSDEVLALRKAIGTLSPADRALVMDRGL